MGQGKFKALGQEKRVTFKCTRCYATQRGEPSQLYQAGWLRLSYRFTLAEKGSQGYMTERQSSVRCPKCAPQTLAEIRNAITERYANCGWEED